MRTYVDKNLDIQSRPHQAGPAARWDGTRVQAKYTLSLMLIKSIGRKRNDNVLIYG